MPKSFAQTIKTVLFSIIVGLILMAMAMWGVSDAFTPRTKDAAAMVGKEKVTLRQFNNYFQRLLRTENEKNPERMTTKQAYARGLHTGAINQLVTERLVQIDATDLGIEVNRADARAFVKNMDVFNNDITGKLDEQKILSRLGQLQMSRKEFEEDIRKSLRQEQSLKSILTGIVAPTEYADQQYKFMTETRKVRLLTLTREAVPTLSDPSDEDLEAHLKDHPNAYISPEYRKFTILRVEIADILPDMEVSDEEIKEQFEYKIKAGQLGTEETRSIVQYVADTQDKADLITAALNTGAEEAGLIEQFGIDSPVRYGNVLEGKTTDDKTSEAAFAMDANTAKTVEGTFGTFYSVVVTDITPATVPNLADERTKITAEIKSEKAKKFIYDVQDIVQSDLDEGMTLEETGKKNGISIASYDFMSRNGETQNGTRLAGMNDNAGVSEDELLLKEIFVSDVGFEGDLFETTDKGIAAVRVDDIKDSAQKPFADIREDALKQWHIEKANEALGELLTDFAGRAQTGESLDALAASLKKGASVNEILMLRAARAPGLSGALAARLFDARTGQTVRGTGANGLDRVIGQIVEITSNTDVLTGNIADTLRQQAVQAINNDIQQAYHDAVLKENPARTLAENVSKTLGIDQ